MASKFEIKQFHYGKKDSAYFGKWYVSVDHTDRYLHSDGVIRGGTSHNGKWSGFFDDKSAALAAINKYRERKRKVKR